MYTAAIPMPYILGRSIDIAILWVQIENGSASGRGIVR